LVSPAENVGAKAARLGRLQHAGLPVPSGACLGRDAERVHLQALGLDSLVAELARALRGDADWRRPAAQLRARLAQATLPPEVLNALDQLHHELSDAGAERFAVRSSTVPESVVGGCFLGLAGVPELATCVQASWTSRWSDQALLYAAAEALDVAELGMAVLVQTAICAVAAGTGSFEPDGLVVRAVRGLGRALDDPTVIPDTWRLDPLGLEVRHSRRGRQLREAIPDPRGGELWRPVAAQGVELGSLTDVAELVRRAEQVLGAPHTIEWALDPTGKLWLVDARATIRAQACLQGRPAAAGHAVGRVHILRRDTDLAGLGPETVLVARTLLPGSTVLLPRVAGIVLEAAGTLSHTATLARERGIPTVVGAVGATQVLAQGSRVVVDGNAGRVWFGSEVEQPPRGSTEDGAVL
jgi:pyruvate,water dikinase